MQHNGFTLSMINSWKSINSLEKTLLKNDDKGIFKIMIANQSKKDIDKTIFIAEDSVFEKAVENAKGTDIEIIDFFKKNTGKPTSSILSVRIDKDEKKDKDDDEKGMNSEASSNLIVHVEEGMNLFVEIGMLKKTDFEVKYRLKSRKGEGIPSKELHLKFSENIDKEFIKIIMIYFNKSKLNLRKKHITISCNYHISYNGKK